MKVEITSMHGPACEASFIGEVRNREQMSQEKLKEAYQTIRGWLEAMNDKKSKEAEEALAKIVNL